MVRGDHLRVPVSVFHVTLAFGAMLRFPLKKEIWMAWTGRAIPTGRDATRRTGGLRQRAVQTVRLLDKPGTWQVYIR